jgi:polyphosphate kinase
LFPLEDSSLVRYLHDEVLADYMKDNVKARVMNPDGTYRRRARGAKEAPFNIQTHLIEKHQIEASEK